MRLEPFRVEHLGAVLRLERVLQPHRRRVRVHRVRGVGLLRAQTWVGQNDCEQVRCGRSWFKRRVIVICVAFELECEAALPLDVSVMNQ